MEVQAPRFNRWVYYAGAVFQSMACAGSVFGWINMAYILEREGVFAAQCPGGQGPCKEQSIALNGLYSAASVFAFVVPSFSGQFLDRFGPRTTTRVLTAIYAVGIAMIIVARAVAIDNLYYVAFVLVGFSASSNLLPLYSIANLFPGRQGLALSVLSGSFDCGTIVFLIMARMYDAGVPFQTSLIAFLCGPVLVVGLMSMFLWPAKPFLSEAEIAALRLKHVASVPTADHPQQQAGAAAGEAVKVEDWSAHGRAAVHSAVSSPSVKGANSRTDVVIGSDLNNSALQLPPQADGGIAIAIVEEDDDASPNASDDADADQARDNSDEDERAAHPKTPMLRADSIGSRMGEVKGAFTERLPSIRLNSGRGSTADRRPGSRESSVHKGVAFKDLEVPAASRNRSGGNEDAATQSSTPATPLEGDATVNPLEINSSASVGAVTTPAAPPRSLFLPQIPTWKLQQLPLLKQMLQPEFIVYAIFFTATIIRFQFYIGTIHAQLEALHQTNAVYTKLFGYVLPCGFFSVFAIGFILDHFGPVAGMSSLCALGLLLSILNLVPSLELQPLTFAVFATYRGFLFCNMSVYISTVFGFRYLGSLIGILTTLGGLMGLLQSPLLVWAYAAGANSNSGSGSTDEAQPDFTPPNLLMLSMMVIACGWPVWLARRAGVRLLSICKRPVGGR